MLPVLAPAFLLAAHCAFAQAKQFELRPRVTLAVPASTAAANSDPVAQRPRATSGTVAGCATDRAGAVLPGVAITVARTGTSRDRQHGSGRLPRRAAGTDQVRPGRQ